MVVLPGRDCLVGEPAAAPPGWAGTRRGATQVEQRTLAGTPGAAKVSHQEALPGMSLRALVDRLAEHALEAGRTCLPGRDRTVLQADTQGPVERAPGPPRCFQPLLQPCAAIDRQGPSRQQKSLPCGPARTPSAHRAAQCTRSASRCPNGRGRELHARFDEALGTRQMPNYHCCHERRPPAAVPHVVATPSASNCASTCAFLCREAYR